MKIKLDWDTGVPVAVKGLNKCCKVKDEYFLGILEVQVQSIREASSYGFKRALI